jgi:tetratricopeptide (TPR) repeat protein
MHPARQRGDPVSTPGALPPNEQVYGQKAFEHHSRAHELDRRRVDANPDDPGAQLDLSIDVSNVASVLWIRGEREEAIEWYARSLEMRERLAAADPRDVYKRGRVAYIHGQLARLYYETERFELGRSQAETAIDLLRPLLAGDRYLWSDLAQAQLTAAEIARVTGRQVAACAAYAAAVASFGAAVESVLSARQRELRAEAERQARACGARLP